MQRNTLSRGFTLVELLLVIAIIGMMVAGATAGMRASDAKKRDITRITHIRVLQQALALYLNQAGTYPEIPSGVCVDGTTSDTLTAALKTKGAISASGRFADPAYMSDPAKCYFYTSEGGSTYTLRYTLERDSVYSAAGTFTVSP